MPEAGTKARPREEQVLVRLEAPAPAVTVGGRAVVSVLDLDGPVVVLAEDDRREPVTDAHADDEPGHLRRRPQFPL